VTAISSIVFLETSTIAAAEACGKRGAITGRFVARRFGAMRRKFGKLPLRSEGLEQDDFSSNRHPALSFCLSMIFSENRCPLFRIML
jgi:hypothetical protein